MTMRMLIDARHREETRVAVVKGNRIEEFDFESAEHKQLKGNIYLAKVTRVEPSLQAAFVDFGGNRHGFLAFSEIHPDYYQIPKEDRDALLAEEASHAAEEEALRAQEDNYEPIDGHHDDDGHDSDRPDDDAELDEEAAPAPSESGEDTDRAVEALRSKRMALRRRYKIQDVIRRRQVLLVQVVKEERGNKGAALTTYLSLAGRYCVLMPNTSHGGGISRKISNAGDRKRLKSIMSDLQLPTTMGCIVRTAGLSRTKVEIKRDFDYLAPLWDEIRETTLKSSAPAAIYIDSDLIKRAIRDIYNRDIDEVIVEGEEGYRAAKDFMKLLMPSHARRVKHYADPVPLFQQHGVEDQLAAMYQPVVQLKSGGYLVINPTEALVSIDINSGRSTREHGIEATAVKTNLEAAHEIARQLRLRDMAGLVVIDFIDMESGSNARKVERAMKEALKNDRARIQVGRISSFGLLEMSRQRLRTGVLEASTRQCPHCEGTGLVRTASSAGLSALRMLEEEAARGRGSRLLLRASQEAAFYVLNRKRAELAEIEARYGVLIEVQADGETEGARMTVEASGPPPAVTYVRPAITIDDEDEDFASDDDGIDDADGDRVDDDAPASAQPRRQSADQGDEARGDGGRRRRRRRRGRRGRRDDGTAQPAELSADNADVTGDDAAEGAAVDGDGAGEAATDAAAEAEPRDSGKPRRGRRGGRGRGARAGDSEAARDEVADTLATPAEAVADAPRETAAEKPKARRGSRKKAAPEDQPEMPASDAADVAVAAEPATAPAKASARRGRRKAADADADTARAVTAEPASLPASGRAKARDDASDTPAPEQPRRGWWQRTFGGDAVA